MLKFSIDIFFCGRKEERRGYCAQHIGGYLERLGTSSIPISITRAKRGLSNKL
jgi:hypothetical protein